MYFIVALCLSIMLNKNGMLRLIIQAISLGNAFEVDEHNIRVRCSNRNLLFLGIWTQVVLTYDSLRCLRKNQSQKSYLCFWWKPIVPSNGSMALRGINPDIIPKVAALLFRFVRNHWFSFCSNLAIRLRGFVIRLRKNFRFFGWWLPLFCRRIWSEVAPYIVRCHVQFWKYFLYILLGTGTIKNFTTFVEQLNIIDWTVFSCIPFYLFEG